MLALKFLMHMPRRRTDVFKHVTDYWKLRTFFLSHYFRWNLISLKKKKIAITGLGMTHIKIRVEYALFEWMTWYKDNMPGMLVN